MALYTPDGVEYIIGSVIGKGGEGTVYELPYSAGLVLKQYNETLSPIQAGKLKQMVAMRNPAVDAYAAWPAGLVYNDARELCGFVMKKLTGFVPLHMIFSPMDRKKLFPDKGYNFLVHVARNLATAFHKLHEAGLVVGDVNEGNILINANGLVSFIDCDSFQVKGPAGYFFCEVGVPRYTPPELLRVGSFTSTIRTANTDSFSLAVLIFQLLFLGRHPFAGKNRFKADIDEETAIREHEFAYSLVNTKKKLQTPNDSFDIRNLSEELIDCFHRAFEQEERPLPADWVRGLDNLLGTIVTCDESRLHTYPGKMKECPWCWYRKTRGILYFLDDSYLKDNTQLNDIENFVNGFRLDALEFKKWSGSRIVTGITPAPIAPEFVSAKKYKAALYILVPLFILVLTLLHFIPVLPGVYALILMPFFFVFLVKRKNFGQSSSILGKELKRRRQECQDRSLKLESLIDEHDNAPDLNRYNTGLEQLSKLILRFRQLPEEFLRLKKEMEEHVYEEQLHWYLRTFDLEWYPIPSIGTAKKTALANSGIKTAADITQLSTLKVPGIGPKNQQLLLSWQRQMATGFVYIPDNNKLADGLDAVNQQVQQQKLKLEAEIRQAYQSLTYLKSNIANRSIVLENRISEVIQKANQYEADLRAFEKFVKYF